MSVLHRCPIRESRLYPNKLLSKNLPLCTCNYPFYSAYNSLNHLVNFGQFELCTGIEKNPGPSVYVDATKTINAPYCQGNVTVFGENAGQQCVARSLCALIYSKITKITSVDDIYSNNDCWYSIIS